MLIRYFTTKYLLTVTIPFVFGAFILAESVLRLFSTAKIAGEGVLVVPMVALSNLFFAAYVPIAQILVLVKKTRITGAIWIVCSLVNLGLNILVVRRWGILGAAITTLIAYGLALGLTTYYSFKEFRFPVDWRFIIKSLIASAIMSLAIWLIHPQSNLATNIAIIVGGVVYGLAIFLLKGFRREEISFFRGLLRRSAPPAHTNDDEAQ